MFLLFTVISVLFLGIGLWKLVQEFYLYKCGIKAEGKVIRNEKINEYRLDSLDRVMLVTLYKPYVEFQDKYGRKLEGLLEEGYSYPKYKEGDVVKLIYPKEKPQEFQSYDYPENLSYPIFLISLSIMFLTFAVVYLIYN